MLRVIGRHPILTVAFLVLGIAATYIALLLWAVYGHHRPLVDRPYVIVETTRCLGTNGQPVGDDYGQPCPPGTKEDRVFIESYPS